MHGSLRPERKKTRENQGKEEERKDYCSPQVFSAAVPREQVLLKLPGYVQLVRLVNLTLCKSEDPCRGQQVLTPLTWSAGSRGLKSGHPVAIARATCGPLIIDHEPGGWCPSQLYGHLSGCLVQVPGPQFLHCEMRGLGRAVN